MRLAPLMLLLTACPDSGVKVYNEEPVVNIVSPADGSSYDEGEAVTFEARVSDNATAPEDLELHWQSDLDGELSADDPASSEGVVLLTTAHLNHGNHAITLSATDEDGALALSPPVVITINDVPDSPEIVVVHPASGESGVEGEEFEFVVTVSDEQQAPETLVVVFESDVDDTFCTPTADSTGVAACDQVLSAGDHFLTFTVLDEDQIAVSEVAYFTVVAGTAIDDDDDGYTEDEGDCNDGDASVYPTAEEFYNERDDDCDGVEDDGTVGYDDDTDGQSELDGDCDDEDVSTYEGATEVCDSQDNDCDSVADEDTECYDDDGDGLDENSGDCDDSNASSYPGGTEIEDGSDNDCDGIIDEGTDAYDDDGDGYTENDGDCDDDASDISPSGTESCNGYDDDCDDSSDEEGSSGCDTYYYDYDGDGYGSSSVSGRCLCSIDGYYTSGVATDCYDYNVSANPACSSYSTSSRGDGSYDWNCDGSESKYYTSSGSCGGWPGCSATAGWTGGVASCGSSGTYLTSCSIDWFSCEESTTTYTQYCI